MTRDATCRREISTSRERNSFTEFLDLFEDPKRLVSDDLIFEEGYSREPRDIGYSRKSEGFDIKQIDHVERAGRAY